MDKLQMIKDMADIIYILSDSFSLILTALATYMLAKNSKKPPKSANFGGSKKNKRK